MSRVTKEIEVEIDVDEFLQDVDEDEIWEYLSNSYSSRDMVRKAIEHASMDTDEVAEMLGIVSRKIDLNEVLLWINNSANYLDQLTVLKHLLKD